ncbi:uncharacterized protein LOC113796029 [Dermatophagoides pteronyssinus]|uniref:uncharacterized protein LOC113796029 n=1 Tax=Dermatophagoides pteronyssinus TaxID=6956 RepID=UPI003F6678FB
MKHKTILKPFDGSDHHHLSIDNYHHQDGRKVMLFNDISKRKLQSSTTTKTKTKTTTTSYNPSIRLKSPSTDDNDEEDAMIDSAIIIDIKSNSNNNDCSQYHHCRKFKCKNSSSTTISHFENILPTNTLSSLIYWLFIITIIINITIISTASSNNHTSNIRRSGRLPPQRFEMEPIDKTSIIGDTIILPCRIANKVGTLQWTRDGFGLGTERTLEGFQRYRMIGSDDEGDYSLEISPVRLEDDAVFQCQVGAVEGVLGIRSRSARFTVQVPPEPPVIIVTHAHSHAQVYKSSSSLSSDDSSSSSSTSLTVSSSSSESSTTDDQQKLSSNNDGNDHILRTTAGMTIELTCEAHGGRPPAELTWMDSTGNPITNGVSYSTTKLSDGKRWNAALKWTVVASRSLDGQRVTCRSENAALKSASYAHIQLEVRYPPEVELRIASINDNNDGIVREGDDLTLECLAIGNPSLMTFKWSRDGVPLNNDADIAGASSASAASSGDGTPRLIFRHIGREFHGTVIACEVANSVGTTRSRLDIKVAFKPRFVKIPEPVIGLAKNEHIRLNCNIDSYPIAQIYWHRFQPKLLSTDFVDNNNNNNNWQTIGDGQSIQISEAGRYRCLAKNEAFDDELKAETLVFNKGAPLIRSPSIQYGIENEPVRLQCIVEAVPPPTKITWFKLKPYQQLLGVDNNEGYEILEEEESDDYSMLQSSPSYQTLSSSSSSSMAMIQSSSSSMQNNNENNNNLIDQLPSSLALLRSIIYMRRAKDSDFGQYNCSVWNQYGFQSQIITLQKQSNILSPLVLTLSGIICFAIVFVLVTSLLIFICIRSQRLTNNSNDHHSLTPKKLDSLNHDQSITTTTTRRSVCNGTSSIDCNGMIIVANDDYKINSMEKNILMKNTIMKMNGSNQILTTLTTTTNNGNLTNHHHHHHSDLLTTANNTNNNGYNGLPPIYNNNDFLHSNNDSYSQYSQLNNLITRTNSNNGGQLIATTTSSSTAGAAAATTYSSGQYLSTSLNDYGGVSDNIDHSSHCNANGLPISSYIHDNNNNDNKAKISISNYYHQQQELQNNNNSNNNLHLYSTVKKNHQNHHSSSMSTDNLDKNITNDLLLLNNNNNNCYANTTNTNNNNNLRLVSKIGDQFINPYVRTSTSSSATAANMNGLPPQPSSVTMNHYSNVIDSTNDRSIINIIDHDHDHRHLLSAGVYHTSLSSSTNNNNHRYKTNSLGGNSSSSGVISTGGSSPPGGHSPIGSINNNTGNIHNGTHV